jgi:hypothetical protein
MVAAILEGDMVTIDVAKLRSLARYQNDAVITADELTELLDAYEERDRLRAALTEQGLLQKKPGGGMVWHTHDCPASFDFAQCNCRCRVARAALEGRE